MVRQLSAVMFADMVGYTALMQEDERKAKAQRDRQREVLNDRVTEFEGKILEYYGDGALSIFQSAVHAIARTGTMAIPSAIKQLNESDALLDKPSGQQTIVGK